MLPNAFSSSKIILDTKSSQEFIQTSYAKNNPLLHTSEVYF